MWAAIEKEHARKITGVSSGLLEVDLHSCGRLAQLVRAADLHSAGRGFESLSAHFERYS